MRAVARRALLASTVITLALGAGACASTEGSPAGTTVDSPTSEDGTDQTTPAAPSPEARTADQQAFLDDLTELGLPTGMSADTTVEVGIGICQNLDSGVDTDTILEHIRSLSSAIASQSPDHDTDRVGRAIVEASRTHLCD